MVPSKNVTSYTAPELVTFNLKGRLPDGRYVRTSYIVGVTDDDFIKTKSGSIYELGEPDEEYEKLFPDSKNRVIKQIKECH